MTRTQQKSASITHHRLFGPGLALWFGALFGLSSLAVRTSLFEALVVASRIDQVVPAAAPPLGHAARLLLALGFAVVGGMIGWAVARAIAGHAATAEAPRASVDLPDPQPLPIEPVPLADEAYQVRARDAHPDAPARRPILAREELRHAEFATPITPPAAAWVVDEPLPAPFIAPVVAPALAEPAAPPAMMAPPPPPSGHWDDDGPVLGPARDGAAAPAEPAPILTPVRAAPATPPAEPAPAVSAAAVVPAPEPQPLAQSPAAPEAPARPEPALPSAAQRIASAPPTELSHVELIARLAVAMQRREALGLATPPPADDSGASGAEALRATLDSLKGTGHG